MLPLGITNLYCPFSTNSSMFLNGTSGISTAKNEEITAPKNAVITMAITRNEIAVIFREASFIFSFPHWLQKDSNIKKKLSIDISFLFFKFKYCQIEIIIIPTTMDAAMLAKTSKVKHFK